MTSDTAPPTKQWLEENCKRTARYDILWEKVDAHWEIVEKSASIVAKLQQELDRQKAENSALQGELDKLKGCPAQSCDRDQLATRVRRLEGELREKESAVAEAEAEARRVQGELREKQNAVAAAEAAAKKAKVELAKQNNRLGGRINQLNDQVRRQTARLARGVKVVTKYSRQVLTRTVERTRVAGRVVAERLVNWRRQWRWGRRTTYQRADDNRRRR